MGQPDSEAVKNVQPSIYLFDGGYASFNSNGAVDGWHYYIQDYMGNNRMVVNKNGTTEQVTHYYPYGGVIGDISTNENVQKYKFEGKELDRTFGLDNYDIHARQYFAMMPSWDRIDPLAEKYYGIGPYAYCGGDPVNYGDFNGKEVVLFATSLPSDIYIPLATHTFVAVFDNNKRCIGYYAYGGTEPVSGQLRQLSYSQDKEVISSYEKGEKNDFVKGEPFVINPPNGMSEEEFDNAVIETSETFGNMPGIQYSLYPGDDDTLGNCNTSSTTLLLKAGASKEQIDIIESQMPGLHWGFGTEKPWTFEEQNKAIKEAQKELNKKLQYLDVNRGH